MFISCSVAFCALKSERPARKHLFLHSRWYRIQQQEIKHRKIIPLPSSGACRMPTEPLKPLLTRCDIVRLGCGHERMHPPILFETRHYEDLQYSIPGCFLKPGRFGIQPFWLWCLWFSGSQDRDSSPLSVSVHTTAEYGYPYYRLIPGRSEPSAAPLVADQPAFLLFITDQSHHHANISLPRLPLAAEEHSCIHNRPES